MRKILLLILVVLLGTLSACEDLDSLLIGDTHEHTYNSVWKVDETHHWHQANCVHSDQVSEKAEHTWDDGQVVLDATEYHDGRMMYTCTVCGVTKTETIAQLAHDHQFADEYSSDDDYHWYEALCAHQNLVEKIAHTWDVIESETAITSTCSVCGKEKVELKEVVEEQKATLEINYKYVDGEVFAVHSETVVVGESYEVVSPKVDLMVANQTSVLGVMTEAGVSVDVVYQYSNEVLETVAAGQKFSPMMVDSAKGLSISYVAQNVTSDWEEMVAGETFAVYAGCLRNRDCASPVIFSADWYDKNSYYYNDATWNSLLTTDGKEMVVTWSFNPDGSIKCYKNGLLTFYWTADHLADGYWNLKGDHIEPSISTLVEAMFAEIRESGFSIGSKNAATLSNHNAVLKEFRIGYAVNDSEVKEILHSCGYHVANIQHYDTSGLLLRTGYQVLGRTGESFDVAIPEILGYVGALEQTHYTFADQDYDIRVVYTPFAGIEQLTEPLNVNKMASGGWTNTNEWAILVEDLSGDYTVRVKYNLDSGPWQEGQQWRTVLPIHFDAANTGVRWVCRFDWYGWVNGDFGTNPDHGSTWVPNFPVDYLEVNDDCDITATYTRRGDHIEMYCVIVANTGMNAGRTFYWKTSIDTKLPSISLALMAEYANVTVYSVEIC